MEPTLHPGDGLLATPYWPVRTGQIRCLPDPRQPGRWLVKRVGAIEAERMRVVSDNRSVPTSDSRAFGAVPVAGTYLVLIRVPGRFM